MRATLALEDGRIFQCRSFTGSGEVGGEIVFNTSMTGYQEIITDPSYSNQIVVMTYPMIGIYGINFDDLESTSIYLSALIVKEYQSYPSNFRSKLTLVEYLSFYNIIGIEALDTRALTRHIRKFGSMRAFISTRIFEPILLTNKSKSIPIMKGLDLVSKVTTTSMYRWESNKIQLIKDSAPLDKTIWKSKNKKFSVLVVDYGLKFSILRNLELHNFEIIVVPASTDPSIIEMIMPNGILLSSGPGDPSSVTYAIKNVKVLISKGLAIFGICLGHQILGLAMGAATYKLKFGHRGVNQPVENINTGNIEITSQNHGFAIDPESISDSELDISHVNINDNTVEGIEHKTLPIFSVQFHPEASPGPRDSKYLFEKFKKIIFMG